MEPQERDLITTLLERLKSAAGQPKDPEADTLIRQAMTQQPDAPYYLVQTVLIQDLSLNHAQNRIAELEKQAAALAPPAQPTSFLGGLFSRNQPATSVPPSGPWTRAQQGAPPPQYAQPQPQYAPQQGYAPQAQGGMFGGGGNSFLKSAAATAAGVAGGALLFQGISSLFGHGYASGLGGFGGMGGMGMGGYGGGISETVINNYGDSGGGGGYGGGDYGGGGGYAGGDYGGGGGDYGGGSGGDYGGGGGGGDYGGGSGGDYDSGGGGSDWGGGGGGGDSGSSSC